MLEVVDKPVPTVADDEVLVRVCRATLCGTDLKIRSHTFFPDGAPPPGQFTPGHEYAGVVVAVGCSVDEFAIGDRVVSESHRGCMRCANCLRGAYTDCLNYGNLAKGHRSQGMTVDGGFAEYAVNPVSTLHQLPDSVSFDDAAILTTVGTVMHSLDVLNSVLVGARVAVVGPGPIGLLAVQVLRELGASFLALSGTRPERLAIGEKFGADLIVDARTDDPVQAVREATDGVGVDVVLECSGAPAAVDQALQMTRRGGDVILVGFFSQPVTVALNLAVMNGITIHSVRGEGTDSLSRAIALAARGRLSVADLVTHHYPLAAINDAFATYAERADGAIKVMLDIADDSVRVTE
jgi:L-iditol 2-dehydrogenase